MNRYGYVAFINRRLTNNLMITCDCYRGYRNCFCRKGWM